MTRELRILCVDDNELVADALRVRIGGERGMTWLGWVNGGHEVEHKIESLRPDIVLMDLDMPGTETFGLIDNLAKSYTDVAVVVLSGHVNPNDIDRALDCGAWGYLSKNENVDDLIACIRQVGRGEIALSKEVEAVKRRAAT